MNISNLQAIRDSFKNPLPGEMAQNKMSPIANSEKYRTLDADHKVACVMALLHPKNEELFITFIKRASSHADDKHAGQIGFPGGKKESTDDSLIGCALREVNEEIGIDMDDIEVIGKLTSLYVFASNFLVHAYVGYLDYEPQYIPQIEEVAGIYEVPLSTLRDPAYKVSKQVKLNEGILIDAPGYKIENDFLWGATAMMSSELEGVLSKIDF